jgi:alpha-aminoadipate/glutamate carrier protein LysW
MTSPTRTASQSTTTLPPPPAPTSSPTTNAVHAHTSINAQPVVCACPECAGEVRFARSPLNGEVVRCGDCSAELEVTSTSPIRLELAPTVEEDWGE